MSCITIDSYLQANLPPSFFTGTLTRGEADEGKPAEDGLGSAGES